jgi:uncharacterized membrane protein (DUF106 family)
MTDFPAQLVTWVNVVTNALGEFLLSLLSSLPGWLSNTIISAVTGVLLLIIFKYTSNQRAIGRARDDIKAHMLALKLFKDSLVVTLKAQGRVFRGAFLLLFHAIRPMLVMIVPVSLLLGQMSLWYQSRPLRGGEEALVVMGLNGDMESAWPEVSIKSTGGAEVTTGPVRVLSKRQIYWKIKAVEDGYSEIDFGVDGQEIKKELAIGKGFMRVSSKRPGWEWSEILMYPREEAFGPDSAVKSISIDYPERLSRTSGTDWWIVYFFVVSMVFAFIFKPFLKVRI